MYFQFAHLLFSAIAVAVSATRQLLSGLEGFELESTTNSRHQGNGSVELERDLSPAAVVRTVIPSPLDHVARLGPFSCLSLIFVDVLLRVLRMAVFLSATHLQPVVALSVVAGSLLCALVFLWPFHKARRPEPVNAAVTPSSRHFLFRDPQSRCFLHDIINPFMLLLSPWCLYAALACRPYFSTELYVFLGVLDTLGMTAFYAEPLLQLGFVPFLSCPYDVYDICESDIVPSSCFPKGLAIAFASVWAASVLLWLWAGFVMMLGGRRDKARKAKPSTTTEMTTSVPVAVSSSLAATDE